MSSSGGATRPSGDHPETCFFSPHPYADSDWRGLGDVGRRRRLIGAGPAAAISPPRNRYVAKIIEMLFFCFSDCGTE